MVLVSSRSPRRSGRTRYGLPAVANIGATRVLEDGQQLVLDGIGRSRAGEGDS
jgi:hypothetical protein